MTCYIDKKLFSPWWCSISIKLSITTLDIISMGDIPPTVARHTDMSNHYSVSQHIFSPMALLDFEIVLLVIILCRL